MAPFARDMGHVDAAGDVLPPFVWDEERRLFLSREAKRSVLPPLRRHRPQRCALRLLEQLPRRRAPGDRRLRGSYCFRELCLAWMNALAAGDPDAEIAL